VQQPPRRWRVPARRHPNYALRRLVALVAVVLVIWVVARGIGALASLASGAPPTRPSTGPSASSPSPSPAQPLVEPPACRDGDRPAEDASYADWAKTVLDTDYRLDKTYVPPDLVPLTRAGFREATFTIRQVAVPDLAALRKAAAAAGVPIDVVAAYRSYYQQLDLFDRRVRELGRDVALAKTARPGHSEHQLGTALDFRTAGQIDVDIHWGETPTGKWVEQNAWRYGFVQSYPDGSLDVTCYSAEPWHFRYLGRDLAAQIHRSGLTIREFLWNRDHGGPAPVASAG
jgi:D-alanyl-D-alanine carboxypeptidase